MRRRTFLKTTSSVGAATAAGVFGILRYPRGVSAAGWGAWPDDKEEALLPAHMRARNVLEVHINGGLGAFDSFYTVPSWGVDSNTFVHQFAPGVFAGGEPDRDARFTACGYGNPATDLWSSFGATDQNGVELFLGPWLLPLRNRPDILRRMRIVVQRHDQVAHEGANPLSFTGDRLGQPRLAGLGTSIQRYFSENPEVGGVRAAPYAYVLYPGSGFNTFNARAASAVGFHPGSARPLGVSVDANSQLNQLLARPGVEDREAFDAAIGHYRAMYNNRFRPLGQGKATRSAERDNYDFADFARRNSDELQEILSAALFGQIPPPDVCNDVTETVDMPGMQARLAASLLTRPENQARYVLWVDTGIRESINGGYDTHFYHTRIMSQNVPHTFATLAEIINNVDIDENDPEKINLDETMVVINTEFGRTPYRQVAGGETGTNHWPQGYVNVLIGGPVSEDNGNGRSVYGYMSQSEGIAQQYVTPAENRMMVMQALGIFPFSSQTFAVGDVRGGVEDELEAALRIRDTYLGVSV
jgi:hypothetical protein